jgi:hypothetical protein
VTGGLGFENLLAVAAAAFAAPLALGLVPRLRLPAVVLELVLGIVLGPDVLGWVEVDDPVRLLSLLGLGFILLLAGLELDPDQFRGRLLRLSVLASSSPSASPSCSRARASRRRSRAVAAPRRHHRVRDVARGGDPGARGLR